MRQFISNIREEGFALSASRLLFKIASSNRIELYELLSDYTAAGIDIVKSLEAFLNQTLRDNGNKVDLTVMRLQSWLAVINDGGRFCDALNSWVPERERMLIEAYETSGSLSDGLQKTVKMMDSSGEMQSIWVGALAYPIFLFIMAGSVIHLYGTDVIPKFASMYPVEKWTGNAAMFEFTARSVVHYWPYMACAIAAFAAGVLYSMPWWKGPIRAFVDKLPPYSFYKIDEGAAFMVSLNAMLQAGVPVLKSVENLRENAGPWLGERLDPVITGMNQGKNIATAMKEAGFSFPDKRLISLMELHADKNTFVKALPGQVERWITRSIKTMRKKAFFLNLGAMVAVAALAGWIYLSIGDISSLVTSTIR